MRAILVILGIAVLAGCAPTKIVWDKPGATPQDYSKDAYECERDQRAAGLVPGSFGGEGYGERCMEAKGWRNTSAQ